MPEMRVMLFSAATESLQSGGIELIDTWRQQTGSWIWVDIQGVPDDAERRLLTEQFNIAKLAIQDAHRDRHPPKLEIFDDYLFIMLRDLIVAYEDSEPEVADLALFVGKNFFVSRHHAEIPSLNKVHEKVGAKKSLMRAGPARLTYMISRQIIDAYTPEVLELEQHLERLEDQVYESANDDVIESLSRYNRALKRLRRHLVYQCNVVSQLSRPNAELPLQLNKHEFNDLFENLDRLASLCQLNQELAVDLLNTHLSLLSHRLNQVMRVLTIATVIFLPLGLLAGLYGMNFEYMPELGWQYGYFAVLGAMATVVTTLIVVFKRRGWL
jgi:magnesium transporter